MKVATFLKKAALIVVMLGIAPERACWAQATEPNTTSARLVPTPSSVQAVKAIIENRHDTAISLLASIYPVEYDSEIIELALLYDRNPSANAVLVGFTSWGSQIRDQHFTEISQAPDSALREIGKSKLAVQNVSAPRSCCLFPNCGGDPSIT